MLMNRNSLQRIIFILCITISSIFAQEDNSFIEYLIGQTNLDSLISYVRILSGEDSVQLGDSKVLIRNRSTSQGRLLAAEYIKQKLEGFNLDVEEQIYSSGKNVIATQTGISYPDNNYIICAHYDAITTYCADDNASGVAAVLESARILSKYMLEYTLVFALWDEEEPNPGLYGSGYYASQAASSNMNIRGVLNLEMFGWDGNNDGVMDIHSSSVANSYALANLVYNTNLIFDLPLNPVIFHPGTGNSDHGSFWDEGFGAICISQAYWAEDFNPYYHSRRDRIDKFNLSFFHEMTKLAIASISTLAENLIATVGNEIQYIPITYSLDNYPNPFNNSTIIQYKIPKDEYIVLSIYNCLGEKVTELVNEYQRIGNYKVRFDADNISSGVYILTISTLTSMRSKKIILLK